MIHYCYENRLPQQPLIGHSRHPLVIPAPQFVIPAKAGIQRGWGEGIVALGLVPSLGRAARSRTLHRPPYHHFRPLAPPSQGHGDSHPRISQANHHLGARWVTRRELT